MLAETGIEGPRDVIEARDGFLQAFAFGRPDKARAITLPPAAPFGITDCYIKPYPCCRHIQPAVEALIGLLEDEKIASEDVRRIDVATYRIAAEHAETGWDDFASAQLSFPYLIGLALKFRGIKLEHSADEVRRDPWFATIARKLNVTAPPDLDRLYPQLRPARVTVTPARRVHADGGRGAGLAHRAARRRRIESEVRRPGRTGAGGRQGRGAARPDMVDRRGRRRGAPDRNDDDRLSGRLLTSPLT